MNKELIHFDQGSAERDISIIKNKVIPIIKGELLPAFNDLDVGLLTTDLFLDMISSRGVQVETVVTEVAEKQLSKAGIKSRNLKKSMVDESLAPMEKLRSVADKINSIYGHYGIFHFIDFVNGNPVLTEEKKSVIEDRYKIYVETNEGFELRKLHNKAVEATNIFLAAYQKNNRLHHMFPLKQIFKINNGEIISVSPELINYDQT